jgi:hypothetical protein
MKKSSLTTAIFLAALAITTLPAHAATAAALQTTIQGYGLTAAVSGSTVTVTGTKTGATDFLSLNIDAGVTVNWTTAQLDGNNNSYLVIISGTGSFNMSGGKIENSSSSYAIYNNSTGTVTISGGTVSATTGRAVYNNSTGKITVSGTAMLTSQSDNSTIYNSSTDGTIEITGGTVENTVNNPSNSNNGKAIDNSGTVNISGGTVSAITGNAVRNSTPTSTVTISGGTVSATTGNAVRNDSTGKITVSGTAKVTSANVTAAQGTIMIVSSGTETAARLEITGGTVENTAANANARAVYNASTGTVSISGGVVKATTGYAVYKNSTGTTTLTGGLAFAYGTAANNVIYGDYTNTSGNAVVLAWDNTQATNTAFTSTAIFKSAGTAQWLNKDGKAGIDYANGANTGFIELAGVTVSKATPSPIFPTAAAITYDPSKTLATVTLNGGTGAGIFAWQNGTTVPTVANSGYPVVFTPTDAENYNTATQNVSLAVAKAAGVFGSPAAVSTTYTPTLTLANISLPANYAWTTSATALNAGNSQTFAATYTDPSGNYNSATGNIIVNVAKAAGTFGIPAAVNTTYTPTLTLANVTLPTGYAWNAGTTALNAGNSQSFAATYTDPSGNYNAATGNITVNVAKATPNMVGVSFPDQAVTHNGQAHSISISGTLPSGVSVSYTGNGKTDVGVYTVTATFAVADPDNWNVPDPMTATLEINNKITPDMSGIAFADKTVTYSGSPQNLAITGALPSGVTVSYTGNGQTNAGEYEVTAVFAVANTATHNVPAEMTARLTIAKANPSTPAGLTATAGQTLASVTLPAGWAWATPTALVGEAGTRTHKANFAETANYNAATNIDVSVAVTAETPISVPQIAGGSIRILTTANAIVLENLPKNAKVEVYSLQGKRIYSSIPGNPQILRILVQTKGMYVVKIGSETVRVAVR